jgi:hypothetical protein
VPYAYQIFVDGSPVNPDLYGAVTSVEVEENADLPGAAQMDIPVLWRPPGTLTYVDDASLAPYVNLAIVVTAHGQQPECIFDGFILSHKLRLDRGTGSSSLQVWGQDASWLMNLTETAKEWADVTDGVVANSIFGVYGFSPAPDNTQDDSAAHNETGHTLMQRASDIQFLRQLARRNGKLCRVISGQQPKQRTGYFAKPKLDGKPVVTLTLNDPAQEMVAELNFEWDVARPTSVLAGQALFTDPDGPNLAIQDAGLPLLGKDGLGAFAKKPMVAILTTTVDDAGELQQRAVSLLREGAFFVRCTGEVDLAHLGMVLRVGTLVAIEGVGALHTGSYYVWSVRHKMTLASYKMSFVLVRNALGEAVSATADTQGGLV